MSKVIKSHHYVTVTDSITIEVATPMVRNQAVSPYAENPSLLDERIQEMEQILASKEQILRDAEQFAEQQLIQSQLEIESLKEQALREIDSWWHDRRQQDEQAVEEARQSGYHEGFQQGSSEAEVSVQQHYADQLNEARSVLEQSYLLKTRIIQEAEPFLIELSSAIAEKIIGRQLTVNPEWIIEMTQAVLSRRRDKGVVTLCVSPKQFAYIQDARDELQLSVDSQAELQILPDATVADHGCVIRTSFGSVDARIDTQLKEIKAALQHMAMTSEESADYE
ncbi:FliH/SctL family protein [Paenibacillus sp. MBLB4367]|uniref:FliH/SctL family protein n=1 Tax=Paenibacillus sp. MBLB4367 TaxID=3384767 RepID=UPI003907F193